MPSVDTLNLIFGAILAAFGWVMTTLWKEYKEMQKKIDDQGSQLESTKLIFKSDITTSYHGLLDEIRKLSIENQKNHTAQVQLTSDLRVTMANDYAKRSEVESLGTALFKKLDRIEEKIDAKEDKK